LAKYNMDARLRWAGVHNYNNVDSDKNTTELHCISQNRTTAINMT